MTYDTNGLQRKYVYGPGIDETLYMSDSSGSRYYFFDGLGSVVALARSSAGPEEKYSYDVFGEPNRISAVGNRYMFTGREYDSETGLYYYRARYYKPGIGRFLQTDPTYYSDGLNLYTYVKNNPINIIDPSGKGVGHSLCHAGCAILGVGCAAGCAVACAGLSDGALFWCAFKCGLYCLLINTSCNAACDADWSCPPKPLPPDPWAPIPIPDPSHPGPYPLPIPGPPLPERPPYNPFPPPYVPMMI
jgi:RHS repeat-associated protein